MQLRFNCHYLEIDPREAVSSIETKQRHHGDRPVRPLWPNRAQLTRSTELGWDAQRRSILTLTLKLTLIRRARPGPRERKEKEAAASSTAIHGSIFGVAPCH